MATTDTTVEAVTDAARISATDGASAPAGTTATVKGEGAPLSTNTTAVNTTDSTPSKTEGESNGLPPAAPEVQLDPPPVVIYLREFVVTHIKSDPVHNTDPVHMNELEKMFAAIAAKLHGKYPAQG